MTDNEKVILRETLEIIGICLAIAMAGFSIHTARKQAQTADLQMKAAKLQIKQQEVAGNTL